jgi:hypothetical protein
MAMMEERQFQDIPVERIEIGPEQARTTKLEVDIEDLAESIKRFGLIHPITVFPRGDKFETVVGLTPTVGGKKIRLGHDSSDGSSGCSRPSRGKGTFLLREFYPARFEYGGNEECLYHFPPTIRFNEGSF